MRTLLRSITPAMLAATTGLTYMTFLPAAQAGTPITLTATSAVRHARHCRRYARTVGVGGKHRATTHTTMAGDKHLPFYRMPNEQTSGQPREIASNRPQYQAGQPSAIWQVDSVQIVGIRSGRDTIINVYPSRPVPSARPVHRSPMLVQTPKVQTPQTIPLLHTGTTFWIGLVMILIGMIGSRPTRWRRVRAMLAMIAHHACSR